MPLKIDNININPTIGSVISTVTTDSASADSSVQQSKEKISKSSNDFQLVKQLGFDRASKNYVNSEPQFLFVSEYVVDNTQHGALLVFEKFFESTHYEIFKRNLFSKNADFERILFIDSKSLEEERKNYIFYIKDVLGFDNIDENAIFIFHDDSVKSDRIYEYKIKAAFVPRAANEVDYDSILESKGLLKTIKLTSNTINIFGFAAFSLNADKQAWIISLLNEKLSFFGKSGREPLAKSINADSDILVPTSIANIMDVINDSTSLFGLKATVGRLLNLLGALDNVVVKIVLESIDEASNNFSIDMAKVSLISEYPGIDFKSNAVSQVLNGSGAKQLNSIDNFSLMLNYINAIVDALSLAQEGLLQPADSQPTEPAQPAQPTQATQAQQGNTSSANTPLATSSMVKLN